MAVTVGSEWPNDQVATEDEDRFHAPPAAPPHPSVGRKARQQRRLESLIIFLVFAIGYGVIGYQTISAHGVVVFDAIDRLARADMVWWNAPPKLAAIGFVFPPLQSLILLPAAVFKPVASSLVALPITSSVFAGLTMVVLNSIFRRCELPFPLRIVLLVAYGLNPLWVFYAGNGMSEAVYSFFLAAGIAGFIGFYITEETRYLMGAGIGLTLAGMTRYGFLIWAVLISLLVTAMLARRRATGARMEGALITIGVPIIYGFGLWTFFNALIVGSPFGWLSNAANSLAVNSNQVAGAGDATLSRLASRLLEVVVAISPLSLVIIPLLILTYVSRRSDMALWLATLVSLGVLLFVGSAVTNNDIGQMTLRSSLPIPLVAVIGLAWVYREAEGLRLPVYIAGLALVVLSIPFTWTRMLHYPYQNQEQAFIRSVRDNADQEGKQSIGGYTVGIREEKAVAAYLKRAAGKKKNSILTDNAQTYAVILLNGRPDVFFDRVDKGDAKWRDVRNKPFGKIDYMLISTARNDLIRQHYPKAAAGGVRGFTPVFKTDRYTVLKLSAKDPAASTKRKTGKGSTSTKKGGAVQTAIPTFTPEAPAVTPTTSSTTTTTTTIPAQTSTTSTTPAATSTTTTATTP